MQNSSLYGCQWHTMLKPVRERDYEKPRALYPSFDAKSTNIGWGLTKSIDTSSSDWQKILQGPQTRLNRNIKKGMMRSFDTKCKEQFTGMHDTFSAHVDKSLGVQTSMLSRMTVPEARGIVHRRAGATTIHGFRATSEAGSSQRSTHNI